METGQRLTVEVTGLAYGGDGVARSASGRVVFIPFTAPGDEADVEIVHVHSRYARARLVALHAASAARETPNCPYYGRCGGCCYQHLAYAQQVEWKRRQLQEVLGRLGGFETVPDLAATVPAAAPYGYRNKLSLEPVLAGFTPGAGAVLPYGFCELDNVTYMPIDECPLAAPALNDLLAKAGRSTWARRNARRSRPGKMTLRVAADNSTHFYFGRAPRRIPWLREDLDGRQVRVPLGSFWQVNPAVSAHLVRIVTGWLRESPQPLLIDVYAGAGPFSLALGASVEERILIEKDGQALLAAHHNHMQWALGAAEFVQGRAEAVIADVLSERDGGAAASVVVDPPRSGCPLRLSAALRSSRAPQLVYVSCNAATLARDLKCLCAGSNGFHLQRLACLDMFPQTPHFEVAALLQRELH